MKIVSMTRGGTTFPYEQGPSVFSVRDRVRMLADSRESWLLTIVESPFAPRAEELPISNDAKSSRAWAEAHCDVIQRNLRYAREIKGWCVRNGMSPIASHTNLTQPGVLDDTIPGERALGIAAGLAWREVADLTVFGVRYGWSNGMRAARETIGDRPYLEVE